MQGFQSTKIACAYNIDFTPQFLESFLIKRLREYIGKLIFGVDIRERNISICHMITDEMIPYFNMLCLAMEHRIVRNFDGTLTVT